MEKTTTQLTTKSLFSRQDVRQKFEELLGQKAQGFITSVLQIASQNEMLSKAEPLSIYNSAAVAATLDLPLNNNLGFAYIVPYNNKQPDGSKKVVAQFQLGYKGFIQLAQRSGQFKTIAATPVYEGQLIEQNPLSGFQFDFSKKESETVIGYASYFKLLNGFEKTLYMNIDQLKAHGVKYSKTFSHKNGLWNTDFDAMAQKTVIKLLLSRFAPLSVEMQTAVIADQGVINENNEYEYPDNEPLDITEQSKQEEFNRIRGFIEKATTAKDLKEVEEAVGVIPEELQEDFQTKMNSFNGGNKN